MTANRNQVNTTSRTSTNFDVVASVKYARFSEEPSAEDTPLV